MQKLLLAALYFVGLVRERYAGKSKRLVYKNGYSLRRCGIGGMHMGYYVVKNHCEDEGWGYTYVIKLNKTESETLNKRV